MTTLRLIHGGQGAGGDAMRVVEREAERAAAMETPCACGQAGSGHGPASSDALAVPVERVA